MVVVAIRQITGTCVHYGIKAIWEKSKARNGGVESNKVNLSIVHVHVGFN